MCYFPHALISQAIYYVKSLSFIRFNAIVLCMCALCFAALLCFYSESNDKYASEIFLSIEFTSVKVWLFVLRFFFLYLA